MHSLGFSEVPERVTNALVFRARLLADVRTIHVTVRRPNLTYRFSATAFRSAVASIRGAGSLRAELMSDS